MEISAPPPSANAASVRRPTRMLEGRPHPLGATWDGLGVNFALFSANATRVELCLFDLEGRKELERIDLPEYTDEVWHGYLSDARPGTVYGYRVHGPYDPENGHRFNPHKLLLDPYAKAHIGALRWSNALFGYKLGSSRGDLVLDRRDSAQAMPKCVVQDPAFTWGRSRPPHVPWEHTVLYELHVKGFTKRHPAVPPAHRGTFAGLGHPAVVDHLVGLGVTAVELLPVHAFVDDRLLLEKGLRNYWGYNSIGFFAPDPRYMAGQFINEFKEMVARLHDAGIEVILDVVYNHTAEGNEMGPTLSFKGIDNASYYRLMPDNARYYINDTGTGNTINVSHARVLQMITDSLRYWALEMGVDGFRFDLATILARESHGFDAGGRFLDACRQDPVLSALKLIAEPWDVGPGGYQVGAFPPGWAEWNDRYRDTLRSFWKGDEGQIAELGTRLTGSADLFNRRGRRPWSSVNFITAHDGFTLADLVSYNDKHNDANGEDNRDGHSENLSWNHGAEGPTDDPEILALRARQMRNMLASLIFSQGTPMLLAGDEMGRTQGGNNNAYCQDNEINWLEWADVGKAGHDLIAFVRRLLQVRRTHALLRRGRYLSGAQDEDLGVKDIAWLTPDGEEMSDAHWHDPNARALAMLLDGRAPATGVKRYGADATLLLIINAHHEVVPFVLPDVVGGREWRRLVDTAVPDEPEAEFDCGHAYRATGRSLALLELQRTDRRRVPRSPGE
ncbi:MAG: glycogen debranching protein [Rhodospirillaceae bacterium BRH_c57]|nr:MAG: glycogen debranching protein [Rhodospirillaceae bacterium BRH_c57]